MTSIPPPTAQTQTIRKATAEFMRQVLPHADPERQILGCRTCGKATVPVPDPRQPEGISHCYRCAAVHLTGACALCGAAAYRDAGPGALRCEDCRG